MPITLEGADERDWAEYRKIGSPTEINSKIRDLISDNGRYRDRHREDAQRIADLEAKLPKDGSLVLTKEQAAEYAEYQKLGKPSEVSAAVSDGAQAKARLAAIEKRDRIHEAARTLGWQPSLAERIRGIDQATVELKDVQVRNEKGEVTTSKVPYVTPAGENQTPVPLADYVQNNDPELLPLLPADIRPDGNGVRSTTTGAPFVPHTPGGTSPRGKAKSEKEFREATEQTASYIL